MTPPEPPGSDSAPPETEGSPRPTSRTETARRAYVTGVAATIAEAAVLAGITEGHALQRSAAEGWVEERKACMAKERAALASESAEQESRVQAGARRLAWRAALKAIQRMEKLLDDPNYKINPFGVEAMVRAAMALSGLGDQEADEAVLRLRRRPTREIVREFVKAMQDLGVDDAIDVAASPVDASLAPSSDSPSPSVPPP